MATPVFNCPPREGWEWLMRGINTFRKKPSEWFLLGNTYLFVVLFVGVLVPFLGAIIVTLITPALGYGVMLAGRMSQSGLRAGPFVLFSGFTRDERPHLQSLMILGAVYTVSFALLKLLATLVVGPQPDITMEAMQNDPQARMQLTEYMVLYMMFVGVCSLPVILAFWYAPALVVWHKMRPVQALFSSWVAVWRNKGPFLIYGMGWLILALGFSSVILVMLTLLGLPAVLLGVVQVLIMAVVMGATLATIYPSYEAVLEGKQEAPLDPWNPGNRGDDI